MNGSDILLSFIILIIFTLLFLINILGVGTQNIKDKWPEYRCNPIIMPFANIFGEDTIKNFSFCVENLQQTFMQDLLAPIYYVQKVINDIGVTFNEALNSFRAFFDNLRNMITNIVESIMAIFLNFLIGMQHMIISIKDLFAKTIGTLAVFMYVLEGAIMSMESAWGALPGQMVRTLCFHPNTLVKLKNGNKKLISNILTGDILKNNQVVHGTMQLHNIDNNNNYIESLYKFNGETSRNPILVSGSHLIFDPIKEQFIKVKNHPHAIKSSKNSKILICLITSDHTIPLGDYIFHDWEDNQGSLSKNV